jgi:predicted transcriptional regulator
MMSGSGLPPQVRLLAPREREIAEIIYFEGSSTANDVQSKLSCPISGSAIRSMLRRLVTKGILDQQLAGRGRRQWHVYTPAITSEMVQVAVLEQVIEQYFRGSVCQAAKVVIGLMEERERRSFAQQEDARRQCGTADTRIPIRLAS